MGTKRYDPLEYWLKLKKDVDEAAKNARDADRAFQNLPTKENLTKKGLFSLEFLHKYEKMREFEKRHLHTKI